MLCLTEQCMFNSRHTDTYSPMFNVTVMMFRDMVESVTLLNDEDWRDREKDEDTLKDTTLIAWGLSGVSPSPFWVLWVSVCGGDGVSRDGTMCSAPSSYWTCSSITDDMHSSKHHIQPEHVMHSTVLSALIGPESHVMHTSRLSALV